MFNITVKECSACEGFGQVIYRFKRVACPICSGTGTLLSENVKLSAWLNKGEDYEREERKNLL